MRSRSLPFLSLPTARARRFGLAACTDGSYRGRDLALGAREQMANLPLNSRDLSQLISLQPGRRTSAPRRIDGSEVQTAHGQLPSGVTGATLGLEAVQEVKILMSNYSAQHGRSAGATVVAATRSGTNDLHGSSCWYHRDDSLDARNDFDPEKPGFKRNQFGASLGGPVAVRFGLERSQEFRRCRIRPGDFRRLSGDE